MNSKPNDSGHINININLQERSQTHNLVGSVVYPKSYFIGMMDILGFKNLVEKNKDCLEKIYTTLYTDFHDLPEFLKNGVSDFFTSYDTGGGEKKAPAMRDIESIIDSVSIFSDTILFYIESTGNKSEVMQKIHAMCNVMNSFLVLPNLYPHNQRHQLALRGAIAQGRCMIDKPRNIFFGKPIIDAYQLEGAQRWMGGALHPSIFDRIDLAWDEAQGFVGFDAPVCRYHVPLKEKYKNEYGKPITYALNWIQSHPAGKDWFPNIPVTRPLYKDLIEGNFMKYEWGKDADSIVKYYNTLKFAKRIIAHYNLRSSKYYWTNQ